MCPVQMATVRRETKAGMDEAPERLATPRHHSARLRSQKTISFWMFDRWQRGRANDRDDLTRIKCRALW